MKDDDVETIPESSYSSVISLPEESMATATAIDRLLSLRPMAWDLVVEDAYGRRWEFECSDPAVAIMRLEELLQEEGVEDVVNVSITFEASVCEAIEA